MTTALPSYTTSRDVTHTRAVGCWQVNVISYP